ALPADRQPRLAGRPRRGGAARVRAAVRAAISLRSRFTRAEAAARLVAAAEDLGIHGVWVNEPWGFDAGAVLGWIAASTRRVLIGTHVCSVYARPPAATAGLAGALQRLSDGRFRAGLGSSGPQVVEGWHGVPY